MAHWNTSRRHHIAGTCSPPRGQSQSRRKVRGPHFRAGARRSPVILYARHADSWSGGSAPHALSLRSKLRDRMGEEISLDTICSECRIAGKCRSESYPAVKFTKAHFRCHSSNGLREFEGPRRLLEDLLQHDVRLYFWQRSRAAAPGARPAPATLFHGCMESGRKNSNMYFRATTMY